MNEEEFIEKLALDELVIDRAVWYDLTSRRVDVIDRVGSNRFGSMYVDPVTNSIHYCNILWKVTNSFVVINEINPQRIVLRTGNLVTAIVTHPFRINLVLAIGIVEPHND